jgi:hypothetical protein
VKQQSRKSRESVTNYFRQPPKIVEAPLLLIKPFRSISANKLQEVVYMSLGGQARMVAFASALLLKNFALSMLWTEGLCAISGKRNLLFESKEMRGAIATVKPLAK